MAVMDGKTLHHRVSLMLCLIATYLIVIRYAQSLAAETLSAIIRMTGSAFPMKPTLKYVASKGVKSLSDKVNRELLYATILTTGASMQDT
jgi:hypothetical protein